MKEGRTKKETIRIRMVEKCKKIRRMASSGMLHRMALVRTDVSEELSASFIRVIRSGEQGTTPAVTGNRHTAKHYSTRTRQRVNHCPQMECLSFRSFCPPVLCSPHNTSSPPAFVDTPDLAVPATHVRAETRGYAVRPVAQKETASLVTQTCRTKLSLCLTA
jgi:hypothetical protein